MAESPHGRHGALSAGESMLELEPFGREDFDRVISWIPDARSLQVWCGPRYSFPLDHAQLGNSLAATEGRRPPHLMFKAVEEPGRRVVGHVELLRIDYEERTAWVGRVLIGPPELRGQGYGTEMLTRLLDLSFGPLGLRALGLGVFDFNRPAIKCYTGVGFRQVGVKEGLVRFGDEAWTLILMRLTRQ